MVWKYYLFSLHCSMKHTIKNSQKQLKGIYKITNLITNDCYIGSTKEGFYKRFGKHKSSYKNYINNNKRKIHPILYNAYTKYGIDNFIFEIIEILEDLSKIQIKEEFYIKSLNSKYNTCKIPTKGGCPNLNKKLSKEWKNNIRLKSKLYKHSASNNLKKVTINNKLGSSLYKIITPNEEFTGSLIDCAKKFNVDVTSILNWYQNKYSCKFKYIVIKLKSQKKKIKVFFEKEILTFNSFNDCDKYLNKWRGHTSTMTLRKEILCEKYMYEIIDDIV